MPRGGEERRGSGGGEEHCGVPAGEMRGMWAVGGRRGERRIRENCGGDERMGKIRIEEENERREALGGEKISRVLSASPPRHTDSR